MFKGTLLARNLLISIVAIEVASVRMCCCDNLCYFGIAICNITVNYNALIVYLCRYSQCLLLMLFVLFKCFCFVY